jgi:hypothetical protein
LVHVQITEDGQFAGGAGGSAWDFCAGDPGKGPDSYCSDGPSQEQQELCCAQIASQVMAERGHYSEEFVAAEFAKRLALVEPNQCICRDIADFISKLDDE